MADTAVNQPIVSSTEPVVVVGAEIAESDNPELQAHKPWPADRRYKPRLMSRWLSPTQLASVGLKERIAGMFEAFADRRETLAQREPVVLAHPALSESRGPGRRALFETSPARRARDDLWIDYVADVGDGFSSTYTVAAEIAMRDVAQKQKTYNVDPRAEATAADWDAADSKRLEHTVLQRGELLVMGGDQVYPLASDTEYRNRTIGPYETACRYVAEEPMGLLAVPGNHDWYDGLTAFLSRFCSEGWMGGWHARQTRSYWAAKLQDGWWMWGIDIGLEHTPIDHHQLEYFRAVAEELVDGDQIILVTSKPSWLKSEPTIATLRRRFIGGAGATEPPADYDQLAFFMSRTLAAHRDSSTSGTPPRFALILSGDKHFYCRYGRVDAGPGAADDIDLRVDAIPHVVAGGGGAYLSLPYGLVDRLRLPTDARATQRIGLTSIVRMITRNWGFCAVLAALHVLLAEILGFDELTTSVVDNFGRAFSELVSNGWWALVILLLVGAGTAQLSIPWWQRLLVSLNIVVLQFVALAASAAITVFAIEDGLGSAPQTWAAVAIGVAAAAWIGWMLRMRYYYGTLPRFAIAGSAALVIGAGLVFFALPEGSAWSVILGSVASLLSGAMFAVSGLVAVAFFGAHDNLISVAVREHGHKNFLRLHIDAESNLHVYAIGFEQLKHQRLRWRSAGDGDRIAADTPEVTAVKPLSIRPFGTRPEIFEPRIIDAFSITRSPVADKPL